MKFIISCYLTLFISIHSNAQQTRLIGPVKNFESIKLWYLVDQNHDGVGIVYSIERSCGLVFSPNENDIKDATLVVSGTYTSGNGQIAEGAWDSINNQVGNLADPYFKPNCFLHVERGNIEFLDLPAPNSIGVYKLLHDNYVLSDVIAKRTSNTNHWRFLVEKKWVKVFENGQQQSGVDWLIVDMVDAMTLQDAVPLIGGLARAEYYSRDKMYFKSMISACLLDTGDYRPYLLNGEEIHGTFEIKKQSNVLVVQ
jgi:hypothetical protein